MLSQNNNALGIIFPNSYDNTVPELVTERAMASIPFASRYRMVDFVLSSMANCGISNVSVVVRKNYHSLMDHLGTGLTVGAGATVKEGAKVFDSVKEGEEVC